MRKVFWEGFLVGVIAGVVRWAVEVEFWLRRRDWRARRGVRGLRSRGRRIGSGRGRRSRRARAAIR